MDTRYSHPQVAALWSTEWTYDTWLRIERITLAAQIEYKVIPEANCNEAAQLMRTEPEVAPEHAVEDIARIERRTKHDVAAFLEWVRSHYPPEVGRWLHFGLTSSDVVDTAQGIRFRAMHPTALGALGNLMSALSEKTLDDTALIGRTHGQPAELITMRTRAYGWLSLLATGAADLSRDTSRVGVCKMSGTVGTYAHNPPEIEQQVARTFKLRPHGPGATQIATRASLAAWAASANNVVQACAKIAHDIRLMGLLGETAPVLADGQVGSSAMAHKVNPIQAEQIAGMARLASGYAMMLADLGTWLERDISMSSVERIAVPDLWHVTLHTIVQTTKLIQGMKLDCPQIEDQIRHTPNLLVHTKTLDLVRGGYHIDEARRLAMVDQHGLITTPEDAFGATMNYPGAFNDRS